MTRDQAITADLAALAQFSGSPAGQRLRGQYEPFPFNTFADIVGGSNWVIARRSPKVIARYGDDVVCLSLKRYRNAERLARLVLTEGFD
jgi:hypothetical protein